MHFPAIRKKQRTSIKAGRGKSLTFLKKANETFGIENFLNKGESKFSARSNAFTKLYSIENKDFLTLIRQFPEDYVIKVKI